MPQKKFNQVAKERGSKSETLIVNRRDKHIRARFLYYIYLRGQPLTVLENSGIENVCSFEPI